MQGITFKLIFRNNENQWQDISLALSRLLSRNFGNGVWKKYCCLPELSRLQRVSQEFFGYALFSNPEQQGTEMLTINLEQDPLFTAAESY